ncbi:MAG: hypothetical protein M1834_000656 [Cirrosporium novae-zelandiae]|nr:MAG: hypothetical protein M1834_000656 [Cirrosporium novae-zelandiae]
MHRTQHSQARLGEESVRLPPIQHLLHMPDSANQPIKQTSHYPPSPTELNLPSGARSFAPSPPMGSCSNRPLENYRFDERSSKNDQYQLPSPSTSSPRAQQLPPLSNPSSRHMSYDSRSSLSDRAPNTYIPPMRTDWSPESPHTIGLPPIQSMDIDGGSTYPIPRNVQFPPRQSIDGPLREINPGSSSLNGPHDQYPTTAPTMSHYPPHPNEQSRYLQRHSSYPAMQQSPMDRSPFGSNGNSPVTFEAITERPDYRNRKRRGNLPKWVTDILKDWLQRNLDHPYPTEDQKFDLMNQTNMDMQQLSNWFINARRRKVKPMKTKRDRGEWTGTEDDFDK